MLILLFVYFVNLYVICVCLAEMCYLCNTILKNYFANLRIIFQIKKKKLRFLRKNIS